VLGQARATQRHEEKPNDFEERVRERVVANAERFGRYGYRRIEVAPVSWTVRGFGS
jgi:hypothetical protein